MTKFFKTSKKPYFGTILGLSCPNLDKNNVFGKRALLIFQYLNYLPLCQKSEKVNEPFLRKLLDEFTKNQFIPLISLEDIANVRVLRLTEKSRNLIREEHFRSYLRNQNFPKYEIRSSIQQLQ